MINQKRLTEEFLELTSIPSLSRQEGKVARRLESILKGMGASIEVDGAGERIGGDTGNILARFPGNTPGAPAFLLSGHMDTVGPAAHVRTIVEGDIIHTDHTSVLGGDDKAGLVAILEAIRVLRERALPHGDLEVVITICEESGLLGAKHFDTAVLRARRGLVLDVDGVNELVTRAPAANRLSFTVHGLEAHAGICPERGISAVQVASEAIAGMRLGRVDAETTANLGVLQGGLATNIVPSQVVVRGETRSLSEAKLAAQTEHMRTRFEEAAARHAVTLEGREHRARVDITGRAPVRAPQHCRRRHHRAPGRGSGPRAGAGVPDAIHRGRIRRQRVHHPRDRGGQSRVRDAGHPYRQRVGGREGPRRHRRAGAGDRPGKRTQRLTRRIRAPSANWLTRRPCAILGYPAVGGSFDQEAALHA